MKIEVFQSSNSEDWMWRVESVGRVAPMENEVSYPSKRAACRGAEKWIAAMLQPFTEHMTVALEHRTVLDREGNEVIEITWGPIVSDILQKELPL